MANDTIFKVTASYLLTLLAICRSETLINVKRELGGAGCWRGRGSYVYMVRGDKIDPRCEAEGWEYKGTKKEFDELKAEILADPTITSVSIEGGWNWAASVRDMNEDCYEPWVGEWEFKVFSK